MIRPGIFRLILALIVLVHHSFALRLGAYAVAMFFVLSGFWISRMWREKYSKEKSPFATFIKSRWWRLAPLFITIQFSAALLSLLGIIGHGSKAVHDLRWWVTQPFIAGSTQFEMLLPPTWSLDVEMQFYVLAPILIVGVFHLKLLDCCCLGFSMTAWGALVLCSGVSLETARLDIYVWLFLVGILANRFEWKPSSRMQSICAIAILVVVALIVFFPQSRSLVWHKGSEIRDISHSIEIAFYFIMAYLGIPIALGTVYRNSNKWDRWLGDLSYPLYLFHWIPREWYYETVDWGQPAWRNAILLMLNFLVSILGAAILLQFVDRPIQKWRTRSTTNLVH